MNKKKFGIYITESMINRLDKHSLKSNINKSRIVELALNSYIEPDVKDLSLEESKKVLFNVMDDIERLTKLRDLLYEKLSNE